MRSEPIHETVLVELAGGEGEEGGELVVVGRGERKAVDGEEKLGCDKRDPFVSVRERMITRDPETLGGGENDDVALAMAPFVARAVER